jgi:hypothetical protein
MWDNAQDVIMCILSMSGGGAISDSVLDFLEEN